MAPAMEPGFGQYSCPCLCLFDEEDAVDSSVMLNGAYIIILYQSQVSIESFAKRITERRVLLATVVLYSRQSYSCAESDFPGHHYLLL